ncbi:hypothetical protein FRC08_000502 [Ceratobasidium sp. 394]|nr:hypothetical protein FRC08_000502 [Ceratobasidium sp. 394]
MQSRSASYRVHGIREVLRLICQHIATAKLASCLDVSRNFFHSAAPWIWEDINGVDKLLQLLPGEKWRLNDSPWGQPIILEPLNQEEIGRFSLYARFVKRIKLDLGFYKAGPVWAMLDLVPTRPLLPSLRVLAPEFNYGCSNSDMKLLANAFFTRQLTAIFCDSSMGPRVTAEPGLCLVREIASMSPSIRALAIFLDHDSTDPSYSTTLFTHLSCLRHLRSLTTKSAVLNISSWQLLGSLPALESLVLHDDFTSVPFSATSSSESSFISLRHFGAHGLSALVLSDIWRYLPFNHRLTPVMHDLHLNLKAASITWALIDLSGDVVRSFAAVPLRHLRCIQGVLSPALGVDSFISALQNLEYLQVEHENFGLKHLLLVAQHMPELQFLSVGVALCGWPKNLDDFNVHSSPSGLLLESRFDFMNELEGEEDINGCVPHMARCLATLWPRGLRCAFSRRRRPYPDTADIDRLRELNETIRTLTNTADSSVPSAGHLDARWQYPTDISGHDFLPYRSEANN